LFDALAAGAQAGIVRFPTDASATFSRLEFLAQPIAIQRALISAAAHRLTPAQRDFGFSAVELARRRIGEPSTGRRTPLPGGLELVDEGDRLRLSASVAPVRYPDMPQLLTFEPIHVTPPARLELQDGWLALLPGAAPNARVARRSADLEDPLWLDQDALEATIIVRPPQPGDRMQPLGMRGHRKLSDIFNSLRVPVGARALWPVVTSREVIVGVAGLRIGQAARLTRATRRALELRYDAAEGPPR
jgi:tRNA(Ile)-lysidine synthetase-like protein